MPKLLERIIEELQELPQEQLHRTAVVFPGRRAGILLRKKFAATLSQPVFSPAILSFSDLLFQETGMRQADAIQLQFELYDCYQQLEAGEPFESFLKWGPTVLRDFNEVDGYMLNPDEVFGYLSKEKAIDLWNPGENDLGKTAEAYLNFFRRLGSLYHAFRDRLIEKGEGWQTLISRQLAESLQAEQHPLKFDRYIFAGFNALNKTEESILKSLVMCQKAVVLFEADDFYMTAEHEAGLFMRRYAEFPEFQATILKNGHLNSGDSTIHLIETAGTAAQMQFAANQIEGWIEDGTPQEECLVVLADESLLVPLMSALPAKLRGLNISLGYPLKFGHIASLLQAFSRLLEQSTQRKGAWGYYYYELIKLVQNPLFEPAESKAIIEKLREKGRIFWTAEQLTRLLEGHILHHAEQWQKGENKPMDWMGYWQELINKLLNNHRIDDLQKGMCLQMVTLLRRLEQQMARYSELNNWQLFSKLLKQSTESEQVAFLGEPYAGLQIMGLLETRSLAFENIMVIGLNEGNLPVAARQDGFITLSLRSAFGLPGPREKEAVSAYHFYRLLQHAKNSWLICNASLDDMGQGEPSRYLKQLALEWPGVAKGHFLRQQLDIPLPKDGKSSLGIEIPKTEDVLDRVRDRLSSHLSPSALNTWISCELKFYFSRILGLRSTDEMKDTLEVSELGTLLHETLERLYRPYLQQRLTYKIVEAMEKEVQHALDAVIDGLFEHKDFEVGMNVLMREVALDYLKRFLAQEKASSGRHQLEVLGLEEEMYAEVAGPFGNQTIKGVVDRVDRLDGLLRILDYKTGGFTPTEVLIKDFELDLMDPKKSKAFQLLTYAWLYKKNHPEASGIASGIISFRKLSTGIGTLQLPETLNEAAHFQDFEAILSRILTDIYDATNPFRQTEDAKQCEKCDFNSICNR
jgi:CRISPR/Cas system-associated exonuclease Cas4 (RecB family)